MTVKETCEVFGLSTEQFFQQAYDRHGLMYSIGGPKETHERYLKTGIIPIYVVRYQREMERLLTKHHQTIQ